MTGASGCDVKIFWIWLLMKMIASLVVHTRLKLHTTHWLLPLFNDHTAEWLFDGVPRVKSFREVVAQRYDR